MLRKLNRQLYITPTRLSILIRIKRTSLHCSFCGSSTWQQAFKARGQPISSHLRVPLFNRLVRSLVPSILFTSPLSFWLIGLRISVLQWLLLPEDRRLQLTNQIHFMNLPPLRNAESDSLPLRMPVHLRTMCMFCVLLIA